MVYLVGTGPGGPGLITARGQQCLEAADVLIYDRTVHPRVLELASPHAERIDDGRHHDTRRVLQTNMAEMRVPPHVADMILNHAIKDAPRSRQHYDVHHYIPEKRLALTQWVRRLTKILGYDPNEVMKAERTGYQGKGAARRLGASQTYAQRKARLAEQGRDLNAERRAQRRRRMARRQATAA